jgi:AraC-like DNA-binding protein
MSDFKMKEKVEKLIASVGAISGQGVVFHPQESRTVLRNAQTCEFCVHALTHAITGDFCRYACLGAALQTLTSGEPHYQRCWAGLLYVTVAAAPRGVYQGGIACGGFFGEEEADDIPEVIAERLGAVPRLATAPFMARISSLRPISTSALRGLGLFLLESTLSAGINSVREVQRRHDRYEQQRRIADAYATLQHSMVDTPDVMGDTYRLVSFLHRRDREGAMQFISGHLAKLLLVSNWNLVKLRAHVRVLLAVMTSQDILAGMGWTAATGRELVTMSRIEKADDVETICSEVADLVLDHFGRLDPGDGGGLRLADRVIAWLQGHYHERATLRDAARAVGASVSAIAHRLPLETGKPYARMRTDLRIAEAKRLLAETGMGISEIAGACGFSDQSHFTRRFKAEINLTPGQFRALLKPDAPLDLLLVSRADG